MQRPGQVRRRRDRRLRRRAPRLPRAHPVAARYPQRAGRHLALAGFMGAGKTTIGAEVARGCTGAVRRPRRRDRAADGRDDRRALRRARRGRLPRDRGGGRARGARTCRAGRDRARRRRGPLGRDASRACARAPSPCCSRSTARRAWQRARRLREAARARRRGVPRAAIASACRSTRRSRTRTPTTPTASCSPPPAIHVELGAIDLLEELVPGDGPGRARRRRARGRHPRRPRAARARCARRRPARGAAPGRRRRRSPSLERLWSSLRIGRDGTIVALGGGCTTDVAGFAAATYMRGVAWAAVPTSLVGQVDAAIGGKTAVDLPGAKNVVGAFHWPAAVVIDPRSLETLPDGERANGMAEVVKTGLLVGEPVWELPEPEMVRRCAAVKAARLPRRPARPRASQRAQPRAHVRARARGGGRLRAAARSGRRARAARGAAPLGAARRGATVQRRCSTRAGRASTATPPGRRSPATRRRAVARRGSCCSTRPAGRRWGGEVAGGRGAGRARRPIA